MVLMMQRKVEGWMLERVLRWIGCQVWLVLKVLVAKLRVLVWNSGAVMGEVLPLTPRVQLQCLKVPMEEELMPSQSEMAALRTQLRILEEYQRWSTLLMGWEQHWAPQQMA